MADENIYCAEAQMLIRKPAAVVFEAFIDPEITRNFWFTKGSGKLEVGKKVKNSFSIGMKIRNALNLFFSQ